MKRLVYSPKVWAYVKTDNHGTVNLTDYIVSGSVNRMVNAASSAELAIQNPDMIWTKGARLGNSVFRPMDPITIWLQRIRGHPVQVFTGYLDRVPYVQLYPGVCRLTATCTLKRLMYTFWDLALPFTNSFLQEYGWVGDTTTGTLSKQGEGEKLGKNAQGELAMNDGSIGDLLFAVLKHVVNWDPKHIRIEKLPKDAVTKVEQLWEAYSEDSEAIDKIIKKFMKKYIGEGQYGDAGGGGEGAGGTGPSTGTVKGADKVVPGIMEAAKKHDIPAEMAIATCFMESGFDGKALNASSKAAGYFQWLPFSGKSAPGSYQKCGHPRNLTHSQNSDLGISANAYCLSARLAVKQHPRFKNNMRDWTMYVQGVNCSNNPLYCSGVFEREVQKAKGLMSKHGRRATSDLEVGGGGNDTVLNARGEATPANAPGRGSETSEERKDSDKIAPPVKPSDVTADSHGWSPPAHKGIDILTNGPKPLYACVKAKVVDARNAGWWSKGATGDISKGDGIVRIQALENVGDVKKGMIFGYGHAENVTVDVGDLVEPGDVIAKTGLANAWHTHWFVGDPGSDARDGQRDPQVFWDAFKKGEAPLGGSAGGGGGGGQDTGASYASVLSTAKATAFATQMQFPGIEEEVEANALTGQRSLMNDKPILPFIEQLSQAALRNFMSLPNGDFYAFYPDYFGQEQDRAPYWYISDLEILDGVIDLSDEPLATHVFTTGDTSPYTPGIDRFERARSTGIVSIENVAQSGFVSLNQDDKERKKDESARREQISKLGNDPKQVMAFLQKYGARPHPDDQPVIRNHFFEIFRAWSVFHLMWSRQFLTEFQFTFMPELFPGGLVGLPDHGVQFYIESVTHEFDYEQGFTTTADLSAPATLNSDKVSADPLSSGMVRAATAE